MAEERIGMDDARNRGLRPYHSPKLVDYGSVAKLTQGSGGNGADGALGMTMQCL